MPVIETTLIVLNIVGWLLAAFFLLAFVSVRRFNRGWKARYRKMEQDYLQLHHRHISAEIDSQSIKWLQDENSRLSAKCHAICATARRLKGRGQVTCQLNRTHMF